MPEEKRTGKVLLVTGSRTWSDETSMRIALKEALKDGYTTLINGDAFGADRMSSWIAREVGFEGVVKVPAQWHRYGRSAGPIRNKKMLDMKPDAVMWFHECLAESKGTLHCVTEATNRGFKVLKGGGCLT